MKSVEKALYIWKSTKNALKKDNLGSYNDLE